MSEAIGMLLREALAHQGAGRLAEAEACYEALRARAPRHPDVLHGLGLLAHQRGRDAEAVELIAAALAAYQQAGAPVAPRAAACNNLGIAWFALNEPARAAGYFIEAIRLDPGDAAAHYNLGNARCGQHDYQAAAASYRESLRRAPGNADVLINLSEACVYLGQPDLAEQYCKQALVARPDSVSARLWLGKACTSLGRIEEALACFEQAVEISASAASTPATDDAVYALDAYAHMLNYVPQCSPETIYAAQRRYGERFEAVYQPWPRHANVRDPERRLKIGYVSPDFRRHSVAFFMEPILAHHDRRAVEVYCYYNYALSDAVTARLRPTVDHWLCCKALTDEQLAERIRSDGIDILVDLAGHTRGNRLQVFARKPAPVQVSYLGYPATTGLTAMDYRLVTADTDPAGSERWHSEKLYRLPRSLWCYRPASDLPAVAPETPARRTGHVTFGSMNTMAKLSAATLAVWAELLKRVPGSRLVMTHVVPAAAAGVTERFVRCGVEAERLRLEGRLETPAYRALLAQVDIALDPYPYNGTTTTCDVLWLGVPVVTLAGKTSASRSGYALLKMIGLEELAARDEAEYVAIAAALATDLDRLEAVRQGLRARMEASPLRDEAGFTRELEAAYRAMWQDWCAQGAPA